MREEKLWTNGELFAFGILEKFWYNAQWWGALRDMRDNLGL